MISLSSPGLVLESIRRAHHVELASYILVPGRFERALEQAAKRGCMVRVCLESRPYADASGKRAAGNAAAAGRLLAAGAHVDLLDSVASPEPPLHVKAAIVDGVVFLNDRNWAAAGAGTILRGDGHADVRSLRDSIESRGTHSTRRLATDKRSALAREAAVLRSARRSVDVCSESFGSDNPVYLTLRALAARGVRCRVAVNRVELNPRERRAIAALQSCGVEVGVGHVDEKFCVADGERAWIGSANATSPYCNATQREWAVTTRASSIAVTVRARFSTYWAAAKNPPITG